MDPSPFTTNRLAWAQWGGCSEEIIKITFDESYVDSGDGDGDDSDNDNIDNSGYIHYPYNKSHCISDKHQRSSKCIKAYARTVAEADMNCDRKDLAVWEEVKVRDNRLKKLLAPDSGKDDKGGVFLGTHTHFTHLRQMMRLLRQHKAWCVLCLALEVR